MKLRMHIVLAVLVIACAALAACGGGGGGGGGDEISSSTAPAQVTAVKPLSEHRLLVTFNEAPGEKALDPDNYAIVDGAGNRLDVLAVSPTGPGNDDTYQVLIATGPQEDDDYTLIYPVTDGEPPDPEQGTVLTGSVIQEPELLEVEVLDLRHLQLTFSRPMGRQAKDPDFYTIFRPGQAAAGGVDSQGGASQQLAAARKVTIGSTMVVETRVSAHRRAMAVATEPADTLEVLNAAFGDSSSVVILTTERMGEPLDYVLIIGNILGQSDIYLDPTRNTAQFNSDVTLPRLESVEPLGNSSLLLAFSEPLGPSAEDSDNYALSPTTVIQSAVLLGDGSQVILETGRLFDEEYELTVSNIRDLRNGLFIDPRARIVTFVATGAVNETPPRVLAAASGDYTTVRVQYSKPMGDSATDLAAYHIAAAEGGGEDLQILAAEFGGTGRNTVVLTTGPQQAIGYELTVIGVTDLGGRPLASDNPEVAPNHAAFDGSPPPPSEDVTPPRLLAAEPQGDTGLLLTFSEAVNETADDIGNYVIDPATDVLSAQRLAGNTQVLLETGPLFAIEYQLTASNIEDAQGLLIDPAGKTVAFIGADAVNAERPRVVSAISGGNTTVIVGFSKAMADNATNPGSYSIVQENVNPEVGFVAVQAAEFVDDGRLEVRLTTGSQNEVSYRVKVSGVTDLGGRPLASQEPFGVDPTSALFAGTPPSEEELVDSDGDGVTDNLETLGYVVTVRLANGETTTRQVTGDPNSADTDNDGLNDSIEKTLASDPRSSDTDADGLTDYQEFNEVFSSATNQDSDADGLKDGTEFNLFKTSPILVDSDGDQGSDSKEVSLSARNPRVADIPEPSLEIGAMNLALDVRFVKSTSSGSTVIDSKTATSTLTQSESQEFSNSASDTISASLKLYAEASRSVEVEAGFPKSSVTSSASFKAGFEATGGYSYTSGWSETSRQSTVEAYQKSLTTEEQTTEGTGETRQVEAARISVAVTLKNAGEIAFTIRNIQVTALIQDPADPTRLKPLATLLPDVGAGAEFNLGTLSTEIGPLIFSNDQIFPKLVDSLMANPTGVVFRFSNYDITDEFGRNFAFTSQDITDRTSALVLDFGGTDSDGDGQGDLSETFRVATGSGRPIEDTDGDDDIDGDDRRVVFDDQGKQVGITLHGALQAAGLREYVFGVGDNPPAQGLTPDQIENSYALQTGINSAGEPVQRIYRIRTTRVRAGVPNEWLVLTPTGLDRGLTIDEVILKPGGSAKLAFVQDLDRDNMPALLEFFNNCLDTSPDTDREGAPDVVGDGLDDRFEALIGWEVITDHGSLGSKRSSCFSRDTDGDGLSDLEEAPGVIQRDPDGLIIDFPATEAPTRETLASVPAICSMLTGAQQALCEQVEQAINDPITDPINPDTDVDGLSDAIEISPYQVTLRNGTTVTVQTSPEHFDSDGDGAGDGLEISLGGNPRHPDAGGNFGDADDDGLLDIQEEAGWSVEVELLNDNKNLCPTAGCNPGQVLTRTYTSSPTNPDTDGDGLTDLEEFQLQTAPADTLGILGADTDSDGLGDFEEVNGFTTEGTGDFGILDTDPLDADSDDDKRFDGAEVGRVPAVSPTLYNEFSRRAHVVVRVPGEAPLRVFTNPNVVDADLDGIVDGDEIQFGGDPANFNTDGDHVDDRAEAERGTRPNVPDYLVTVHFTSFAVIEDAEQERGVFDFSLDVFGPDGIVPDRGLEPDDLDEDDLQNPEFCDDSGETPCYNQSWDLLVAGDNDGDHPEVIGFVDDNASFPVHSVSSTPDLFEQITIDGEIVELDLETDDGDIVSRFEDCRITFPGAAGESGGSGDTSNGIFPGPGLSLGTSFFVLAGRSATLTDDRFCEIHLTGFLEVR